MMKLSDSLTTHLAESAHSNQDLWLLDADLGDSYGLTKEVIESFGSRFVQAGIAEQCMISVAAGIAAMGKRPWVFSFAAFLVCRGYDQIRCGVSQMRLPVTLVGTNAGIENIKNGNTHLSLNDLGLISGLPEIDLWSPHCISEMPYVIEQIMQRKCPAYLRLAKFSTDQTAPINQCFHQLSHGSDILILSTGVASEWAQSLVLPLEQRSVSVSVVHVSRIRPLPDGLEDIVGARYKFIYSLEDHYSEGGFGDILSREFPELSIKKFGWPVSWLPASLDVQMLREQFGLDTESLIQWILNDLKQCNKHVYKL